MKKKIIDKIEIKEKIVFEFAYKENAENVCLALALSGFYVKVRKEEGRYLVGIFTDRI